MPVKYFGKKSLEFGRPLWEIVLNLKNFGKGRYVVRSVISEKYPEPSFYKILSVHPHVIEYPENFQGNIFVEDVFRGVKKQDVIDLSYSAKWAGFRLILKDEEPALLKRLKDYEENPTPPIVLPRTAPLPPLWKEILARERGTNPEQIPEIPLIYNPIEPGYGPPRRVANEGEEPSYRIGYGNFKPMFPKLYQHVIPTRDAAREKYCTKKPEPDFIYANKKLVPVDITDEENPVRGPKGNQKFDV